MSNFFSVTYDVNLLIERSNVLWDPVLMFWSFTLQGLKPLSLLQKLVACRRSLAIFFFFLSFAWQKLSDHDLL